MRIRNAAMWLSLPMLVGVCAVAGPFRVTGSDARARVESSSPERRVCGILVGDDQRCYSAIEPTAGGGAAPRA